MCAYLCCAYINNTLCKYIRLTCMSTCLTYHINKRCAHERRFMGGNHGRRVHGV